MKKDMLYTPQEVADFLKISVFTVARKLKKGELRGKKLGIFWRILGADVLDYAGVIRRKNAVDANGIH